MGTISSKGTSNMSCSTNATRSEGVSVLRTTSSARPIESGRSDFLLLSIPSSRLAIVRAYGYADPPAVEAITVAARHGAIKSHLRL